MCQKAVARLVTTSIVAVLMMMPAPAALATPVVDQSHTTTLPTSSLSAAINEGCKYMAQTFTAGITGTLTGVNLSIDSNPGAPPMRVAIRAVLNGVPYGAPLSVRYLFNPEAPLSRLITFPQQIPVVAGGSYAIVVSYKGSLGHGWGWWDGSTGDLYLRGRNISGECPSYSTPRFWYWWPKSFDLHFRTYVEPAP
jgi:hypothetical protein